MSFLQLLVLLKLLFLAILTVWKFPSTKMIRSELYDVLERHTHVKKHFVYEIDWKQNEYTPDSFKFEEFFTVLSNKFNTKHWKTVEISTNLQSQSNVNKCEVYLLLYHIFNLHLKYYLVNHIWCEIPPVQEITDGITHRYSAFERFGLFCGKGWPPQG